MTGFEECDPGIVQAALLAVPRSWKVVEAGADGALYRRANIQVIFSLAKYGSDVWLHVSLTGRIGSHKWFLPDWEEVKRVKNDFLGEGRWAYQVLPPPAEFVNIHPCCLHLWALYERRPALPDFTRGTGSI